MFKMLWQSKWSPCVQKLERAGEDAPLQSSAAPNLQQLGEDLGKTHVDPTGPGAGSAPGKRDSLDGQAIALVVDAEVTSYLMMGALSPGLKRHSVTLFEGAD